MSWLGNTLWAPCRTPKVTHHPGELGQDQGIPALPLCCLSLRSLTSVRDCCVSFPGLPSQMTTNLGFKRTEIPSLRVQEARSLKSGCSLGWFLLEMRENLLCACCLATGAARNPGIPWLVAASLHVCLHLRSLLLCVSVSYSLLYQDTSHCTGGHPNPVGPHFNQLPLQKTPLLNQVTLFSPIWWSSLHSFSQSQAGESASCRVREGT